MKIVFFGTPEFAAKTLQHLLDHHVTVVAVVTKPDKPKGRSGTPVPTPVKSIAEEHRIPYYQPWKASSSEFVDTLKNIDADLYVVVAYGEILSQQILDIPKLGSINVHASLLPKYRGAAPIQQALIDGETETGITIMYMVKKLDAGDMIKQKKVPITRETTLQTLENALVLAGQSTLLEVIHDIGRGVVYREPQEHSQATYTKKIELEDCEIDWTQPAEKIHNLIRGVYPYPGAWCTASIRNQPKRIKIFSSTINPEKNVKPKEICQYGRGLLEIGCGQGTLFVQTLQVEGKKAMSAEEFMKGLPHEYFSI